MRQTSIDSLKRRRKRGEAGSFTNAEKKERAAISTNIHTTYEEELAHVCIWSKNKHNQELNYIYIYIYIIYTRYTIYIWRGGLTPNRRFCSQKEIPS
jgi:hypothetical protein